MGRDLPTQPGFKVIGVYSKFQYRVLGTTGDPVLGNSWYLTRVGLLEGVVDSREMPD